MSRANMASKLFTAVGLLALVAGCTTTMTEAERDALMAECQLIDDDGERAACLERLALGDEAAERRTPVEPVQ